MPHGYGPAPIQHASPEVRARGWLTIVLLPVTLEQFLAHGDFSHRMVALMRRGSTFRVAMPAVPFVSRCLALFELCWSGATTPDPTSSSLAHPFREHIYQRSSHARG
jgi:hypothetical protein